MPVKVTFMRAMLTLFVVGIGVLLGVNQVTAHHAFSAEFDANRPIRLEGAVTATEWINPHSWIHIGGV